MPDGISIHTPIKGVTHGMKTTGKVKCYFNPHTHKGCDRQRVDLYVGEDDFNPHTHKGCDLSDFGDAETDDVFQSTHP